MDNIYINTLLKKKVILHPRYINKKFEDNILQQLLEEVGDKCIKEGFVVKDSIKIVKRSKGYTLDSNFSGNIYFDIVYKAKVCNPIRDNIIKCKINKINKFGVQASVGPLSVIIAKQYHNNKELFNNLEIDSNIDVSVIGSRYSINDKIIEVMGRLAKDKNINYKSFFKENKNKENKENELDDDLLIDNKNIDDEIDILENIDEQEELSDIEDTESENEEVMENNTIEGANEGDGIGEEEVEESDADDEVKDDEDEVEEEEDADEEDDVE